MDETFDEDLLAKQNKVRACQFVNKAKHILRGNVQFLNVFVKFDKKTHAIIRVARYSFGSSIISRIMR